MNHSQLRAFHAVARVGSFTGAAEYLGVSQSTLSAHVKLLEDGYDTLLFHRSNRTVSLTDTGAALQEITQRYFEIEAEARNLLTSANWVVTGTLRLGADAPYSVIPILAAFSKRHPHVERSVFFGNSQDVLKNVLTGASDIGILPDIGAHKQLEVVPLKQDRLVIFTSTEHPLAHRRKVKLRDVVRETVVLREEGSSTRAIFEDTLKEKNIALNDTIVMGSREAVREAVAAGMGVGIVSRGELGHDSRLQHLQISDGPIVANECMICRKTERNAPLISAFFETARDHAEAIA